MNQVDNMINGYVNGTNSPTDESIENIKSDWAIIEEIAKEIAKDNTITSETEEVKVVVDGKRYTIKPGDIFEVEYNGQVKRVRVLGFKHDDLVDQTVYGGTHEKASISFEFLDLMTGEDFMSMNTTNTNENGWGTTKMRKDLNGYTTNEASQSGAIGGLGVNLNNKAYIKQVKKKYIATYNDANSVTICNDYLWLLASSEVLNDGYPEKYGIAIASEGSQYKYYKGVTDIWDTASKGRVKKLFETDEIDIGWWLRSPTHGGSEFFCTIGDNGEGNMLTYASEGGGVAPGFCI